MLASSIITTLLLFFFLLEEEPIFYTDIMFLNKWSIGAQLKEIVKVYNPHLFVLNSNLALFRYIFKPYNNAMVTTLYTGFLAAITIHL
jgi:hypothetical protein